MQMRKMISFAVIFAFAGANFCLAGGDSIEEKIKQLESRFEVLENKLLEQQNCIKEQEICIQKQNKKIAEYESKFEHIDTHLLHNQDVSPTFFSDGFRIGAGATMVLQGTNNANANTQSQEDATDASYSVDIEIEKEFKDLNSKAFVHLETGNGAGVEDELVVFSNVNRDADNNNNVRLTEVWYEQGLFGNKALLTFGKLDPTVYFDNNEVANNETTQFLGRIFRNNPTIEFPDNGAGVRFAYLPIDWLELGYGIFDADSDWEDVGDNIFNIGQITFKTKFFNLDGNYHILGWHNDSFHTKWLDTTSTKEDSYGVGFSFDQKAAGNLTLFTRYGWQNPRVYNPNITATGGSNFSLEHSFSVGLQLNGSIWNREDDFLGLAYGLIYPSDDYKEAAATRSAKSEGHLEAYYNYKVNKYFALSPDFQAIWRPFGRDVVNGDEVITVFGMRGQIDF